MTAPRLVIPNFANIEDKMRRSLGLVGEVGTEFTPHISPVVIADDATRPGCASFRGRRFAFGEDANLAIVGASSVALKALSEVIINRIGVPNQGTAGVLIAVRYVPPDVADPYAIGAPVPWIERVAVTNDVAPVLVTPNIQVDSLLGSVVWSGITGYIQDCLVPIHLMPNAKIIVRWSGLIANASWNFSGEVF